MQGVKRKGRRGAEDTEKNTCYVFLCDFKVQRVGCAVRTEIHTANPVQTKGCARRTLVQLLPNNFDSSGDF